MAHSTKIKNQKGKLIIFSAPSGAGKTTVVKHLLSLNLGLEFSISATSRKPRTNETDAKDYYFLPEKKFREKIQNNEFLEWEEVYSGIFYGTLISEVERIRAKGNHVIFDVDVAGGLNIKKYYGSDALAVFVEPPSVNELKTRLINRSTETEDKIKMRIKKAEFELSFANRFDVILVNDKLAKTLSNAGELLMDFLKYFDSN
ncbi:MAG: guanylate kinase [Mariniphaga sp.]|nr:guanylate kinase [Mariniphaga sp.]